MIMLTMQFTYAQDMDEIIKKHIDAHGGMKKYQAIETMEISGRFTAFSVEKEFKTIKTSNGSYYSNYHLGKHEVTEAFNDKKAWIIDPWFEIDYARNINQAEMNVFFASSKPLMLPIE